MAKKFRLYPRNRFENSEIRARLISKKYPEEIVDQILQQFWFRDWENSLVSFKPFYNFLVEYLQSKRPDDFKRPDYYKFFFEKLLGSPSKAGYKDIQKLAVAFESMHVDRLPISDLLILVEKLKINLDFVTKSLIKKNPLAYVRRVKEENGRAYFIWTHHTLTEYLAADHILRCKEPVKESIDLMILNQEEVYAFKNSWYGTLRFLLESEKADLFVEWLVKLAYKHPENIDDDFSQIVLSVNDTILSTELKSKVFELIYKHYQKQILWLPIYTRNFIGKFFLSKHFKLLENDIKATSAEVETFVHRGNAVAVIDSLFENNNKALTKHRKEFWKSVLVDFANDENKNGVLQRHSLDALVHYKDPDLISHVSNTFKHKDSLVREAFVQFCYQTDADSPLAIDYFVKAIKSGVIIYGRYGLYEIKSKDGIKHLLDYFINDQPFLKIFIDRESIFDEGKVIGDHTLIKNIKNVLDSSVLEKLEGILLTAFRNKDSYHLDNSVFVKKIAVIVSSRNPNFVFDLLEQTKNITDEQERSNVFYIVEHILPYLVTTKNVTKFYKLIKSFPVDRAGGIFQSVVYIANRECGRVGKEIYRLSLKNNWIEPKEKYAYISSSITKQPEEKYNQFKKLLSPEPGKYSPKVFEYFVDNYKDLQSSIKPDERAKLLENVRNVLAFDTSTIKVKLSDKSRGNSQFNWTSVASFYGDALRVAKILDTNLLRHFRQNIINFIPFSFSSDEMTILDIIHHINDKEMNFVYKVFRDKGSDLRYFLPSTFIYIVGEFKKRRNKINEAKNILFSFIEDKLISESDRASAIEAYELFLDSNDINAKNNLKLIFEGITSQDSTKKRLAVIANKILIDIFNDVDSINWRFEEVNRRAFAFNEPVSMEAHSVGANEEELDSMAFVKPLLNLDITHKDNFLNLLDVSLDILREKDDSYWSYVNYLWKTALEYFDNLKINKSFEPLNELYKWSSKNLKGDKSNWFLSRLNELRKKYIDFLGRKTLKNL